MESASKFKIAFDKGKKKDSLEIPLESLTFTGLLKEGYYSCIHLARCQSKGLKDKTLIVKIFKGKNKFNEFFDKDTASIKKIFNINNDHIVQIKGFCVNSNLNIHGYVMEYEVFTINGRVINDLHTYLIYLRETLNKRNNNTSQEKTIFSPTDEELHNFAIQIASACDFLHNKLIVHGDLAARNILLDQNKNIKLTDFGLRSMKTRIITKNSNKVTFRWSSPEFKVDRIRSTVQDVWAFGIVLWEIATLGGLPYSNYGDQDKVDRTIENGHILKLSPIPYDSWLTPIMQRCLHSNSRKRPSFTVLLEELSGLKCTHTECELYNTIKLFQNFPLPVSTSPDDLYYFQEEELREIKENPASPSTSLGSGTFGKTILRNFKFSVPGYVSLVEKNVSNALKEGVSFKFKKRQIFKEVGYHPNVAKIIALRTQNTTRLLLEYQTKTDRIQDRNVVSHSLHHYLMYLREESRRGKSVNIQELGWFSLQIARGMAHLHSKKIIHGYLAARNILLNDAKVIKISDYFAGIFEIKGNYCKSEGRKYLPSCRWASPELIKTGLPTFKSDIWAFGITLWEIATLGDFPYLDIKGDSAIISIRLSKKKLVPRKPDMVHDKTWNIMISSWEDDPNARPKIKKIELDLSLLLPEQEIFKNLEGAANISFPTKITKRQRESTSSEPKYNSYPPHPGYGFYELPKRARTHSTKLEITSPDSVIFPPRPRVDLTTTFKPQYHNPSGAINYPTPAPQSPVYQIQPHISSNRSPSFQHPLGPYNISNPNYEYIQTIYPDPSGPCQCPKLPNQESLRTYQPQPSYPQSQLHSSPSYRFPMRNIHAIPSYTTTSGSSNRPTDFTPRNPSHPPQVAQYDPHRRGENEPEYIAGLMAKISLQEQQPISQASISNTSIKLPQQVRPDNTRNITIPPTYNPSQYLPSPICPFCKNHYHYCTCPRYESLL